jgi:hypothetical protein
MAAGGATEPVPPNVPQPGGDAPGDPASMLAYAHSMSLELPVEALVRTMDAHVAACEAAGARVCQLISASRSASWTDEARGTVTLRAEPRWLEGFMRRIEGDAGGAGGRVLEKSTSTEDLTRRIIDSEATLRARRALRDRLEKLLATRPGALADLLEVERELSRVQSEIDSSTSALAVMRARVLMSALAINYASRQRPATKHRFESAGFVVVSFVDNFVESTVAFVKVIGVILPWAIVAGLVTGLVRRRRRGRGAAANLDPPPAPAEPGS